MFEKLDGPVDAPYRGAFQMEDQYRGMGSYKNLYASDMRKIDKKMDDLRGLEKHIYTNVLTMMAVFVAVFSIINVNVSLVKDASSLLTLVVSNLCTIGAIGFLVSTVRSSSANRGILALSAAAIVLSILLVLFA